MDGSKIALRPFPFLTIVNVLHADQALGNKLSHEYGCRKPHINQNKATNP